MLFGLVCLLLNEKKGLFVQVGFTMKATAWLTRHAVIFNMLFSHNHAIKSFNYSCLMRAQRKLIRSNGEYIKHGLMFSLL